MEPAGFKKHTSPVIVTLSFDDGYVSNYSIVFPIFKQYGIRGTFFDIGEGEFGGTKTTAEQKREMAEAGQEIASHTVTHPYLTQLTDGQIINELLTNKKALEDAIGRPVLTFCYPYGDVDLRVASLVAGIYEAARSTVYRVETQYGQKYVTKGGENIPALYCVPTHQPDSWPMEIGVEAGMQRFNNDINNALKNPVWLNYYWHGIYEDDDHDKPSGRNSKSEFESFVATIAARRNAGDCEIVPFYEGARRIRAAIGEYWQPEIINY